MKISTAFFSFLGVIGGIFGLSANDGQALGAVSTPPVQDMMAKWDEIGKGLNQNAPGRTLNSEIADIVANADLHQNLQDAVRLTYQLVSPPDVEALDALWLETILSRGDSRLIARYLSYRASLDLLSLPSAEALIDRWVWEISDCDGNGNPDNGNPGNDKDVGNAGENPNGKDFGDGTKGRSQ